MSPCWLHFPVQAARGLSSVCGVQPSGVLHVGVMRASAPRGRGIGQGGPAGGLVRREAFHASVAESEYAAARDAAGRKPVRVRVPPFAPSSAGVDNRKPVDRLASKAMILGSASLPSGTNSTAPGSPGISRRGSLKTRQPSGCDSPGADQFSVGGAISRHAGLRNPWASRPLQVQILSHRPCPSGVATRHADLVSRFQAGATPAAGSVFPSSEAGATS